MGFVGRATLGSTFQRQLNSLMETLQQTTPYFVRCVNPNNVKKSSDYVRDYVRAQLRWVICCRRKGNASEDRKSFFFSQVRRSD